MLDQFHRLMSQIKADRILSSKKINFGKQAFPGYELQYIDRETGEKSYARVYCIQVYIITIIINSNSSDDRKAVADQVYACFRWKIDPNAPENQLPEDNEQATLHHLILALQRSNQAVHAKVLEQLENAKGGEYTMALGHSLERFSGIKQT